MVSNNRIGNHSMNLLTSVATYREGDDTVRLNSRRLGYRTKHNRETALSYLSAIV
jgi:hypothetical protein